LSTDGRTEGHGETSIPHYNFVVGGIIMAVLMVETDIITSISENQIQAAILVILFVEIFKTEVIVVICNGIMCFDISLTNNFQYQNQLVDIDNDSLRLKEKYQNY
jgi:hypothetical protein